MARKGYSTITIMPYLSLTDEIRFDNLRIWPFHKFSCKYISDISLRNHIGKILSTYTYIGGKVIENPAIITNAEYKFPNIYSKSIQRIQYLKRAFLIPCMLEMLPWSFITSDNFSCYYQRFQIGEDRISPLAGAIHPIQTGGYNIKKIKFQKPGYIHLPNKPIGINIPVLEALFHIYRTQNDGLDKVNIVNSIQPFFYAYMNISDIGIHSRILNLIMAFELLFGDASGNRENFRNNILKYTNQIPNSEPRQLYPIINTRTGVQFKKIKLSFIEIWAEEFYKLRHKIIHGTIPTKEDFIFKDLNGCIQQHDPHFSIGVNVFIVCVLRKLIELKYKDIPSYYISTGKPIMTKCISGIKNELFKIDDQSCTEGLTAI